MVKALILVTSADMLGPTKTGYWLEEVAASYNRFTEKGLEVDFASPQGGKPPLDDGSADEQFQTEDTRSFTANTAAQDKLNNSKKIADVDPTAYKIVFAAGGHGTCVDFPDNDGIKKVLKEASDNEAIISAVCHGPTLFQQQGLNLVQGKKVTGFSDLEEDQVGKTAIVPFLLEDKLKELGGDYSCGEPWTSHVVADGRLVTGQNPQSTSATASKCLEVAGL